MNAVITGATKGIGKAIAERFAMAGFDLTITARSSTDLTILKTTLEKKYKIRVHTRVANFQKKSDVVLFAEFVKKQATTTDVLVNNIGQYVPGRLFEEGGDKLLEQIQVNLMGAHYVTSALSERFKKQRKGHIFTIGSQLSKAIREEAAFYTISKQALYTWHKLLIEEMRPHNVKATFVMPSSTYTSSWEDVKVKSEELIQPEAIAESIFHCYNMSGTAIVDEISMKTMLKKYD